MATSGAVVAAAEKFVEFVNKSPSPFHVAAEVGKLLLAAGFQKIDEADKWDIVPNKKYFLTRNNSSVIAFAVGGKYKAGNGFSIVAAHTDSPCLKIKPRSKLSAHGYVQLGVCGYGGALFRTWFDRDLTLAGRVFVKSGDRTVQRLVHITRPILYIPNLCIHLDTERDNFKFNKEEHLRPFMATEHTTKECTVDTESERKHTEEMLNDHHKELLDCVSKEAKLTPNETLIDMELNVVDTQPAAIGGLNHEFIAAARLDNLVGTYTTVMALIDSLGSLVDDTNVRMAACYDNEECGSVSAQGAGTALTEWVLRRISSAAGETCQFETAMARSMLVSADQAHALHPNYSNKHENEHRPQMHKGVVIKINENQRYATTGVTMSIMRQIAHRCDAPLQKFVVRNDSLCGSTIGPIMSAKLGMRTIDVGTAQLAMHSIRELTGTHDIVHATRLYQAFYEHLPDVMSKTEV